MSRLSSSYINGSPTLTKLTPRSAANFCCAKNVGLYDTPIIFIGLVNATMSIDPCVAYITDSVNLYFTPFFTLIEFIKNFNWPVFWGSVLLLI